MAKIRKPPWTLKEFENLSRNQKRQLKESSPDVYWGVSGKFRKERKNNWKHTKNIETISVDAVEKEMGVKA